MLRFACTLSTVFLALGFVSDALAQAPKTPDKQPAFQAYVGEVTGNGVYVRSGPSSNYYPVTKLNAGTRVRVVGLDADWLAIVPPDNCYSVVHKKYVDVDPDGGKGFINATAVRVRAGSAISDALYAKQMKLNRGTEVVVIGSHNDDYMRIRPPQGAKLYISREFVVRVPGARLADLPASKQNTKPTGAQAASFTGLPATDDAPSKAAEPVKFAPGKYKDDIAEVDALLDAEQEKPLFQRDYSGLIERYGKFVNQEEDPYAKEYAGARIRQIEDAQETQRLVKGVRELGDSLANERKNAMRVRESVRPPMRKIGGGFDAEGELRESMIFSSVTTPRRYRLVDDNGLRTVAYIEIPETSGIDVMRFLGQRVGVRARDMRLLTEDVDPLMVYTASELVLLNPDKKSSEASSIESDN